MKTAVFRVAGESFETSSWTIWAPAPTMTAAILGCGVTVPPSGRTVALAEKLAITEAGRWRQSLVAGSVAMVVACGHTQDLPSRDGTENLRTNSHGSVLIVNRSELASPSAARISIS
jgi:hypothetical protein